MPPEPQGAGTRPPAIPLSRWAFRRLCALARETGCEEIGAISGATLLGERAALNGFRVPGLVSAGGGCALHRTADGWISLNLARPDDADLLPALVGEVDPNLPQALRRMASAQVLEQGRELGLAIASLDETPVSQPLSWLAETAPVAPPTRRPLVLDLSALWAGPLCGHLLWLGGAEVIKVENPRRADTMREGDPGLFALLNQGKSMVSLDITLPEGRAKLLDLMGRADIVIEAARPRALAQLGIDAEALVRARRGLLWLTITGHGAGPDACNWVGFGDDCGVAGGLSAALPQPGFVGDAIGDPLSGLVAAGQAWTAWRNGKGGRIAFAMSAIVAMAMAEERAFSEERFSQELREWAAGVGSLFPAITPREVTAPARRMGADNDRWLS